MLENKVKIQIQQIDKTLAISVFYTFNNEKFIQGLQFNTFSGVLTAESNPAIINQFLFEEKIKNNNYHQLKSQITDMMKNKDFRQKIAELAHYKFCLEFSYDEFFQQYLDFAPKKL